ncbi:MAG: outer membrane beta-barrel protein [Pseudomonadota bacterium]
MIRNLSFALLAVFGIAGQALADGGIFTRFYSGTEATGSIGRGSEASSLKTVGGFLGASRTDGQLYSAVEGEVAIGLGFEEDLSSDFEPQRAASLSAIAGVHATQDLVLFGRVGVEYAQLRARRGGEVRTRRAAGLRLGIGADYAFTPGFRVRAEVGRSFFGSVDSDHMEQTEIRIGLINQF